jgi:hypothetical protein
MTKPDPELLPIQRPRCPGFTARMKAIDVLPGPDGLERCRTCGQIETKVIASDPLKSDAVGWLAGELGQHDFDGGRA